jgi:hypothetical protein
LDEECPPRPEERCDVDDSCEPDEFCGDDGQCHPGCLQTGCPFNTYCRVDECLPGCRANVHCAGGEICGLDQQCVSTQTCGNQAGGCPEGMTCDARDTCAPCADECAGTCYETGSAEIAYQCPEGTIPAVFNFKQTGECIALDHCPARSCQWLTNAGSCAHRDECEPVFVPAGCFDASGAPCSPEEEGCTCLGNVFDHCAPL